MLTLFTLIIFNIQSKSFSNPPTIEIKQINAMSKKLIPLKFLGTLLFKIGNGYLVHFNTCLKSNFSFHLMLIALVITSKMSNLIYQ